MTDKEKMAVELVAKCYQEAYNSKREQTAIENPFPGRFGLLTDPWPYYQAGYDNNLWQYMGANPAWKSRPTDSIIYRGVESYTTMLTDNRPRCDFIPTDNVDARAAEAVSADMKNWWVRGNCDAAVALAVKDSRKFGVGWLYRHRPDPKGEQILEAPHPDSLMPDPDCTAADYLSGRGASWLVYEYLANVGDLRAAYGKKVDEDFDAKWQPNRASWVDRAKQWWGSLRNAGIDNPSAVCPVYELRIRDSGVEFRWEELGDYEVKVASKKGRRIVVAGGKVMEDSDDARIDEFVPIFAYPETGKFYCAGDAQRLLGPQIMLMRVNQLIYDGAVKSAGGFILVSPQAGLKSERVTNAPVQVLEVKDVNRALRVERGATLPRHLLDLSAQFTRLAEDTLGLHDISQGRRPEGNPMTAQEAMALSESDRTRVRMAARHLGSAIASVAKGWLADEVAHDGWKRIVKLADVDGKEVAVKLTASDVKKMGPMDVVPIDSSSLPASYQENRQLAMTLANTVIPPGAVLDEESLLESLDWPDRKALLARKRALQAPQPAPEAPPMAPEAQMPPDMGAVPPEMMQSGPEMMQNGPQMMPPAPEMGPMPPSQDLMAVIQAIAQATGLPPEQVIAQMGAQGAV